MEPSTADAKSYWPTEEEIARVEPTENDLTAAEAMDLLRPIYLVSRRFEANEAEAILDEICERLEEAGFGLSQ